MQQGNRTTEQQGNMATNSISSRRHSHRGRHRHHHHLSRAPGPLLLTHLQTIIRWSCTAPFEDIRVSLTEFLDQLRSIHVHLEADAQVEAVSTFMSTDEIVSIDTGDAETRNQLEALFLSEGRITHLMRVMVIQPKYQSCFDMAINYLLRESGPLPRARLAVRPLRLRVLENTPLRPRGPRRALLPAVARRDAAAAPACSASSARDTKIRVERVVVLTRHGDRTPAKSGGELIGNQRASASEQEFWRLSNESLIPSAAVRAAWAVYCPWVESNAPSVTGTLTWLGAATQHSNGVWLRERYALTEGALLPVDLHAADIAARSTPFPRCVESCQKLLLGLYPPEHRPAAGNPGALTPIATRMRGEEPMYGAWFSNADSCPRIPQLLHELYSAQEAAMSDDDKALEARVVREIGCNPNSQLALADAIRCKQQYSLPSFAGWSHEFASRVRDYAWDTFMERCECCRCDPAWCSLVDTPHRRARTASQIGTRSSTR